MRKRLSIQYLKGRGIEIGPCQGPIYLNPGVNVVYVDMHTAKEHNDVFPQFKKDGYTITEPDILYDAEKIDQIFNRGTQDFVVANHVIEHLIDPVWALGSWYNVLKPGGVLFMAVPDKNHTFDKVRPLTPPEHFEGMQMSHEKEWAALFGPTPMIISIHQHVWDFESWKAFSKRWIEGAFELLEHTPNGLEFYCVYRKK